MFFKPLLLATEVDNLGAVGQRFRWWDTLNTWRWRTVDYPEGLRYFAVNIWNPCYLVGGLEPWTFMVFHMLGRTIPTDELTPSFFRGVAGSTTKQLLLGTVFRYPTHVIPDLCEPWFLAWARVSSVKSSRTASEALGASSWLGERTLSEGSNRGHVCECSRPNNKEYLVNTWYMAV